MSATKPKIDYSAAVPTSIGPRGDWDHLKHVVVTNSPQPDWKYGQGANVTHRGAHHKHIEIDPFAKDRLMFHNYSLLVSAIAPRPIGFLSTLSKDGKKENLAPFSYFQLVDHDPPIFVLGFSGRDARPKDTLRNLEETGECTINTVSEHLVEAMNAASLDLPYDLSEWDIAGLTKEPSTTVKPSRVKESIFSIEAKLLRFVDYQPSKASVGPHGRLAIIEATRFWAREDAINETRSHLDLDVLRPIGQLGAMSYARMTDTFELPRSNWTKAMVADKDRLEKLTLTSDS